MSFKLEIEAHNAAKIRDWILHRGGVKVWGSVNLSNPSGQWITAADVDDKPIWQAGNNPKLITTLDEVGVYEAVLYKRVPVALRRTMLAFKLTDASSRKVDRLVAKCKEKHGNSMTVPETDDNGAGIGIYYHGELRVLQ